MKPIERSFSSRRRGGRSMIPFSGGSMPKPIAGIKICSDIDSQHAHHGNCERHAGKQQPEKIRIHFQRVAVEHVGGETFA